MSDPYLGEIMIFAGNYAPYGWALCAGQLLPINQYSALFAVIGTTYGGDGSTNFALPDLRGRLPVCMDSAAHLGQKQGTPTMTPGTGTLNNVVATGTVTIGTNNLPAHNHSASIPAGSVTAGTTLMAGTGTNGGLAAVAGASLTSTAGGPSGAAIYTTAPTAPVALGGVATTIGGSGAVTVGNTGSGTPLSVPVPLSNVPLTANVPILSLNFIIATQGIFPPRE
jgi:microcystin-dependent protein